jgi:hypothetical protein
MYCAPGRGETPTWMGSVRQPLPDPFSPISGPSALVCDCQDLNLIGQFDEHDGERKAAQHDPSDSQLRWHPRNARESSRTALNPLHHRVNCDQEFVTEPTNLALIVVVSRCQFRFRFSDETDGKAHRRFATRSRTMDQSVPTDLPPNARFARRVSSLAHADSARASEAPSMLASNSLAMRARCFSVSRSASPRTAFSRSVTPSHYSGEVLTAMPVGSGFGWNTTWYWRCSTASSQQ